jgi:hypothetical protein
MEVNIFKLLARYFGAFMFRAVEDGSGAGGGDFANSGEDAGQDDEVMSHLTELVDGSQSTGEETPTDDTNVHPDAQTQNPANEETYVIKVDGQERTLTRSEMIATVQKAEAAEARLKEATLARQQAEAERTPLQQERAQLKQVLDVFVPQLQQLLQVDQPNWDHLLQTDPAEYVRQKHVWDQRVAQINHAMAVQNHLSQQQQAEAAQRQQTYAAEEQGKLLGALPDWKDAAKAKDEAGAIDTFLRDAGFGDQERNGIVDHRVILVARKAMLYDRMMQQQSQVTQRVQKLPPKTERPGNGVQPGDGRTAAIKRHAQTGTVESGADAILQFL